VSMPPETRKLHDGLIRALIMGIRAWQDWLKAKSALQQGGAPTTSTSGQHKQGEC
jgi:hypothetical protein